MRRQLGVERKFCLRSLTETKHESVLCSILVYNCWFLINAAFICTLQVLYHNQWLYCLGTVCCSPWVLGWHLVRCFVSRQYNLTWISYFLDVLSHLFLEVRLVSLELDVRDEVVQVVFKLVQCGILGSGFCCSKSIIFIRCCSFWRIFIKEHFPSDPFDETLCIAIRDFMEQSFVGRGMFLREYYRLIMFNMTMSCFKTCFKVLYRLQQRELGTSECCCNSIRVLY